MKPSSIGKYFSLCAALILAGCDSTLIRVAKDAERDKGVISNNLMQAAYPRSFRPGSPSYLERDFEAGANFICDEIMLKQGRDICADSSINWR